MHKERPFPVTLVCLFLLALNCYFLVTSFASLNDPEMLASMAQIKLVPFLPQVVMLYVGWIIPVICAMFMMQEANWARWLYLGWGFVTIDYNLYLLPDYHTSIIPIAIYLVCAMILLLPSSNEFFATEEWRKVMNRMQR